MNTNDFSKCKVGDKLWCIQLCDCVVISIYPDEKQLVCASIEGSPHTAVFRMDGKAARHKYQSLFFSNPNIIAPPEPVRLPDYKPGEWIAVWCDCDIGPWIRKFKSFPEDGGVHTIYKKSDVSLWDHHCSVEELPEVLAKWGEK